MTGELLVHDADERLAYPGRLATQAGGDTDAASSPPPRQGVSPRWVTEDEISKCLKSVEANKYAFSNTDRNDPEISLLGWAYRFIQRSNFGLNAGLTIIYSCQIELF